MELSYAKINSVGQEQAETMGLPGQLCIWKVKFQLHGKVRKGWVEQR